MKNIVNVLKLTGKKKQKQVELLREMDENYGKKLPGWKERNEELSDKIADLFSEVKA